MYQRYYKQRKFGRFFGFFTVIGSGLYHFVKTNIVFVKSKFTTKNLMNYVEYLPNNVRSIVEFLEENERSNIKNFFSRSEFSIEKERNFQIYKENLDKLSNFSIQKDLHSLKNPFEKEILSHSSLDIIFNSRMMREKDYDYKRYEKEKETYILYKKFLNFKRTKMKI